MGDTPGRTRKCQSPALFRQGRIFVVNDTDASARKNCDASFTVDGVSWIRGATILPQDEWSCRADLSQRCLPPLLL